MGIQINGNTNNINAGIGSLSIEDLNELDIVGVATASNFKTGSSNLHSTGLTVGNNFLHSTGINVGTGATIHVPSSNVLTLGTNSNERFRIADAASTFQNKLIIDDGSNGHLFLNNTSSENTIHSGTTGFAAYKNLVINAAQHIFKVSNTERLRIDSTGDVRFAGTNLTNNTNKNVNLTAPSYNTSEEDVNLVQVENESGMNQITFGGGTSGLNAATTLRFLTAAAVNTVTGTERLRITSTGRIEIGAGTHINASAPMEFKVSSSSSWGNYPEHITLTDQKAFGSADNGAGIQFGGKYNTAGNATTFGSIHGKKATTADGNYGGILTFNTREHGNSNFERLRIDSIGRVFINAVNGVVPSADYRSLNLVSHAHSEAGISFSRDHTLMGSGGSHGYTIVLNSAGSLLFNTHNVAERMRIDSSGRVVVGGTSAYIGGANLAVMGTGTTQNTYGSFAIGKIGANPTAGTTLANIRLNGGSIGTRRGAEINAVANSNWSDGSSHPTKLTFAVANVNSASATERYQINHYGHHIFTNENTLPSSGSPGTNSFKGLSQHGYQHWGQRQYYSGQVNLTQNQYFNLFSNNTAHDDIIFWLNIKGFHGNRTFATAHGTIGGYGMSVSYQSASGVYGSFSGVNIGSGREQLRWTSTSPYAANWWIWGWYSGTTGTGTHTGWSAAQNF